MKKYTTLAAAFLIMLCLGSVYSWSLVAGELMEHYPFSALQTQIIFGSLIAVFPFAMIVVGKYAHRYPIRYLGYISAVLFALGNLLAAFSQGQFLLVYIGIGLMVGVATGCGYWLSLTTPVPWFPDNKGLITGIAGAGFGLGAVLMSAIIDYMLQNGFDILQVFKVVAISYGAIILIANQFIYKAPDSAAPQIFELKTLYSSPTFQRIVGAMFLGTFAGLLIIGNLSLIGHKLGVSYEYVLLSISLFAIANFSGRISWGYIGDKMGSNQGIFLTLLIQALGIFMLLIIPNSGWIFLAVTVLIGFGFGGNFVLFAKKTAQVYGIANLGSIYPYVFMGYGIAGIAGPMVGGVLYDATESFFTAIIIASLMSLGGCFIGLGSIMRAKKN